MALLQPFFSDTFLFKTQQFSHSKSNPSPGISRIVMNLHQPRKPWIKCRAVADQVADKNVLPGGSNQEEIKGQTGPVKYDWTEEWYPLYLTKDVPEDAPLGLTVFDKQLVLYRDGNGDPRCFEDRCAHR